MLVYDVFNSASVLVDYAHTKPCHRCNIDISELPYAALVAYVKVLMFYCGK